MMIAASTTGLVAGEITLLVAVVVFGYLIVRFLKRVFRKLLRQTATTGATIGHEQQEQLVSKGQVIVLPPERRIRRDEDRKEEPVPVTTSVSARREPFPPDDQELVRQPVLPPSVAPTSSAPSPVPVTEKRRSLFTELRRASGASPRCSGLDSAAPSAAGERVSPAALSS